MVPAKRNQAAKRKPAARNIKRRAFSPEQEEYLRGHYRETPWPEIQRNVPDHSIASIRGKASAMGLRKRRTGRSSPFTIVEELRCQRESLGVKQSDLSKKMGYTASALRSWETGRTAPTLRGLQDWCDALRVGLSIRSGDTIMNSKLREVVNISTHKTKVLDERGDGAYRTVVVCAGGLLDMWDKAPLYASEDHAIKAYGQTLRAFLKNEKATTIRFNAGPVIESWHMTRADKGMTQRVVDPRLTITSTIEIFD